MMAYGVFTNWRAVVSFTLRPLYPVGEHEVVWFPEHVRMPSTKKILAHAGIELLFRGCPGRGLTAVLITVS